MSWRLLHRTLGKVAWFGLLVLIEWSTIACPLEDFSLKRLPQRERNRTSPSSVHSSITAFEGARSFPGHSKRRLACLCELLLRCVK